MNQADDRLPGVELDRASARRLEMERRLTTAVLAQMPAGVLVASLLTPDAPAVLTFSSPELERLLGLEARGQVLAEGRAAMALRSSQSLDLLGLLERGLAGEALSGLECHGIGPAGELHLRLAVLRRVNEASPNDVDTVDLSTKLGYPTTTTRRTLEDLAVYGLLGRSSGGKGHPDLWRLTPLAEGLIGSVPEMSGPMDRVSS